MATPAARLHDANLTAPGGEPILIGVDWEVADGAVGVVVGQSGSGKSRLLRLLNRLDEVSSGTVEVFGTAVADWPPGELRRAVGWVPQRPALGDGSAGHALCAPVRLGLIDDDTLRARKEHVLAVARLGPEILDRAVGTLSGGERLRLGLARALLLEPRLLLLDEPTSALDGAGGAAVVDGVTAWVAERSATLVVATHRIEDVRRLGGSLLVLGNGRVQRWGDSATVLDDPDVRQLLTGQREAVA